LKDQLLEARQKRDKARLVKSARMYAMCRKAGVEEPLRAVTLALAAFEEMQLADAAGFVRRNEPNLEDLAWAFERSNTPEEFEERLAERLAAVKGERG
jgi:hypothetical protein